MTSNPDRSKRLTVFIPGTDTLVLPTATLPGIPIAQ
jgi:hypothetical protein